MRRQLTIVLFTISCVASAAEIPVTQNPEIVPSSASYIHGVATNGRTFLVLRGFIVGPGYHDLGFNATIMNADGTLVTPASFNVGEGDTAAVASNGDEYLVVIAWKGGASGMRVSARGEVLDAKPFDISPPVDGPSGQGAISAAWDGTRYVVIWGTAGHLAFALLTGDARVELVGTAAPGVQGGAIAARNGIALIAWYTQTATFARIIHNGTISDPFALVDNAGLPGLSASDDGFLAVYSSRGALLAQRLDPAGRAVGSPIPLPISDASRIAVTWDGASYVLVWSNTKLIRAMRVGADGSVGNPFDVATPLSVTTDLAAASMNGRTAVAYGVNLSVKLIDVANNVSPAPALPGTYAFPQIVSQYNVHADFDGSDYVLTWQKGTDILFSRITPDVQRLEDDGIKIASGQLRDVIAGAGLTLVLWSEASSNTTSAVRAARINAAGVVLDVPPLELTSGSCNGFGRVLWDGSEFVAFWACDGIQAARISLDGVIVDKPPRQVLPYAPVPFDVARSSDRFQIVHGNGEGPIWAFVATSDLRLATASHPLNRPGEIVRSFSISSDGDDFAVVWNNDKEEIVGQRANWDAEPIGPRIVYNEDPHKKGRPQVRWDGATYTVVWPEVLDENTFSFMMRHVARTAEDVGPTLTVARAPIVRFGPFLSDWTFIPSWPAVVYGRSDIVAGLPWFERLFLQPLQLPRRRASGAG